MSKEPEGDSEKGFLFLGVQYGVRKKFSTTLEVDRWIGIAGVFH